MRKKEGGLQDELTKGVTFGKHVWLERKKAPTAGSACLPSAGKSGSERFKQGRGNLEERKSDSAERKGK